MNRYLLPLAAAALVLAGMGLYRWLNGDAPPHDVAAVVSSIAGNGRPTLVEFGMNSCASCRAMHRVLDELDAAHGERLRIIRVNVMEQSDLTRQWKVRAIPTQVFLDGEGKELYRHLGFLSAQAVQDSFAGRCRDTARAETNHECSDRAGGGRRRGCTTRWNSAGTWNAWISRYSTPSTRIAATSIPGSASSTG